MMVMMTVAITVMRTLATVVSFDCLLHGFRLVCVCVCVCVCCVCVMCVCNVYICTMCW